MASPSTIRPLPVYPSAPTGADLSLFREAKDKLGLDYLIQPVDAVVRSPGRIIALRERPNFICDHAFVPNPNPESISAALEWALGDSEDQRATSVLDMLRDIFGRGVQEVG